MNFKVGNYIEFDINKNIFDTYNYGKIIKISGDEITIHQTEEVYNGKSYPEDRIRVRNLPYDLAMGYIY